MEIDSERCLNMKTQSQSLNYFQVFIPEPSTYTQSKIDRISRYDSSEFEGCV
jgi:hypothetical protein